MATRGVARQVIFYAYDASTGLPKTGDSANFTLRWIKDGSASSLTTGTITEIDSTNLPGMYKVGVDATETNCDNGILSGKSSTSNVVIVPTFINFVRLPDYAPGSSNGLLILGTNNAGVKLAPTSNHALELIPGIGYSGFFVETEDSPSISISAANSNCILLLNTISSCISITGDGDNDGIAFSSFDKAITSSTVSEFLNTTSSTGNAITLQSLSGYGIYVDAANDAMYLLSSSGNGIGVYSNNGHGVDLQAPNENAINIHNSSLGISMQTTGYGIYIDSSASTGISILGAQNGITVTGNNGIVLSGLSGTALYASGTVAGCYFLGVTNGHGMRLAKAGTGLDLKLDNNSSGTWPIVQGYATGMYPLQATVEGNTLNVSASGLADADIKAIDGSTAAATNQSAAARTVYKGTITGATTTTTLIDSGLTQTTTNHWRGRVLIFLSGTLAYQATDITGFDPVNDKLTFTALTATPSVSDTYIIV